MPDRRSSDVRLTRRAIAFGAPALSVGGPTLAAKAGVVAMCAAWLRADGQCSAVILQASDLEDTMLRARRQSDAAGRWAGRLGRLEQRIETLGQRRDDLMKTILATPAVGAPDGLAKLLVLDRLLEGEGGLEHQLLADALSGLGHAG